MAATLDTLQRILNLGWQASACLAWLLYWQHRRAAS